MLIYVHVASIEDKKKILIKSSDEDVWVMLHVIQIIHKDNNNV